MPPQKINLPSRLSSTSNAPSMRSAPGQPKALSTSLNRTKSSEPQNLPPSLYGSEAGSRVTSSMSRAPSFQGRAQSTLSASPTGNSAVLRRNSSLRASPLRDNFSVNLPDRAPSERSIATQSNYTSISRRNIDPPRFPPPPPYTSRTNSVVSRSSVHKSYDELFAASLSAFREHIYIWCLGMEVQMNIAEFSKVTAFYQTKIAPALLQNLFALINIEEMDSRNAHKRRVYQDNVEKKLESRLDQMRALKSKPPTVLSRIANDSTLNGMAQGASVLTLGVSVIDPFIAGRVVSAGSMLCWAIALLIKELQFRKLKKNAAKLGKYLPPADCPIIHLISLLAAAHVTAELDNELLINHNTTTLLNRVRSLLKRNPSGSDYQYINDLIAENAYISKKAETMAEQIFNDAVKRVQNNEKSNTRSTHYEMLSKLILPEISLSGNSGPVVNEYGIYTFWLNVFAQQLDKQISFENNKRFEEHLTLTKNIIEKAIESVAETEEVYPEPIEESVAEAEEFYPEPLEESGRDKVSKWLKSNSTCSGSPSLCSSGVSKRDNPSVKSAPLPKRSSSLRTSLSRQSFFSLPPERIVSANLSNHHDNQKKIAEKPRCI